MYSYTSPRRERRAAAGTGLYAAVHTNLFPSPLDIHFHPDMEVGLMLSGEKLIEFGNHQLICKPGDVWLAGPGEPHGDARLAPTRNVLLTFMPEFIGEELLGDVPWLTLFAVPPAQRPRVHSPQMRKRVLAIGEVLREEIEEAQVGWQSVVRAELLRLLVELRRGWDVASLPRLPGSVRLSSLARLTPALNLAYSSPSHRVSVAEAAATCSMSPSRFQDVFRRAMGLSFGAFCLRARLSFSAHRLLHSDQPVAAIALEAGFADDSHLHRLFVRQYGCTPGQFRHRRTHARGAR